MVLDIMEVVFVRRKIIIILNLILLYITKIIATFV